MYSEKNDSDKIINKEENISEEINKEEDIPIRKSKTNNPRKIIFKDIQTNNNNNNIYKKPLVKLGFDLSKIMNKNMQSYEFTKNKINLLNSVQDLSFNSLLKNYYQNNMNLKEEEKIINNNIISNEFTPDLNMNEYKMIKLIGSGSYANIYLVENYKTKIKYAVKKLITDNEKSIEKIKKEIEILKTLSLLNKEKIKYFIPIYKYSIKKLDITSYSIYLLMPLAKNDWGKEIEKKENIYNEKTLLKILRHLIKGLSIMQYKNIAHRDIKPQNILIMENDDYLLCDFDESIFVKKAFGNYDIKGTEMFICPILENCVLNGLKNTYINIYKSDMYSLGLCFVYAITKNYHIVQTIKSCNNDVLNQNLIFNNVFGGEVFSNFFIDILMKMIAFLEKDRFDFIEMDNLVNNNINENDEKL